MKKSGSTLGVIEFFVGLLALIVGTIYLAPVKFLGFSIGVSTVILSYVIFGVVLLVVAMYGLVSAFSEETSGLAKRITVFTSVVTIIPMLLVLFFQLTSTEQTWLHYLFGLSLLSYAVGRVAIGLLAKGYTLGLRAYALGFGGAIGALAITVFLFSSIILSKTVGSTLIMPNGTTTKVPSGEVVTSLSVGYLVIIALILIGIDLLLSSIFGMRRKKQKQNPV